MVRLMQLPQALRPSLSILAILAYESSVTFALARSADQSNRLPTPHSSPSSIIRDSLLPVSNAPLPPAPCSSPFASPASDIALADMSLSSGLPPMLLAQAPPEDTGSLSSSFRSCACLLIHCCLDTSPPSLPGACRLRIGSYLLPSHSLLSAPPAHRFLG